MSWKQLQVWKCYNNGSEYVSAREKALINHVKDIGYVVEDLCCDETGRMLVVKAEIVEVISIDSYKSYRNCNGKITETKNPEVGEYTSKSQSIARIILQDDRGIEHKVTLFGEVIQKISDITKCIPGNEDVFKLSDLLLMSPLFTYTVNSKHTERNVYALQHTQLNDYIK